MKIIAHLLPWVPGAEAKSVPFEIGVQVGATKAELLEQAYYVGNGQDATIPWPARSVSEGDVIELPESGESWVVLGCGWAKIPAGSPVVARLSAMAFYDRSIWLGTAEAQGMIEKA